MRTMKQLTAFLLVLTLVAGAPFQALAASTPTKFPTDAILLGKFGSTAQKVFQSNFGSNDTAFGITNGKVGSYSGNELDVGDGTSSSKLLKANIGAGSANPTIKYDPTATEWQFSTDGTNFDSFGSGSGGAAGVQLLKNPGFESGVTVGWANTGGTFAAVSSGGNLLIGKGSATFTASATGQFFQSTAYTVPNGLVSQSCAASIIYKGGDAGLKLQVVDGSTNILAQQTLSTQTIATTVNLSFPCPSSGTVRLKVIASAATAIAAFDQAFLGSNSLIALSQAQWIGNVTYTGGSTNTVSSTTPLDFTQTGSTVTSAGSITPASGNLIGFNIPSMGPGVYKVVMNTGMICDVATQDQCLLGISSVTNSFSGGIAFSNVSTNSLLGIVADTFVDSIQVTSSSGAKTFRLVGKEVNSAGNQMFADLTNVPITFDVYYYPSQAQTAVNIGTSSLNWSGYTNDVTAWNTASTTYADPGSAAGVTLTQTTNTNFGTVTTMASNGAGITFTPSVAGTYHVAAHPFIASASAAQICARLVDGSNTVIDPGSCLFISGQAPSATVPLQGDYVVTTAGSPVTLKIQLATSTGTVVMDNGSVAGSPAIQWQISNANQPSSAPVLIGGVASPSTGVEQVIRASFGGASEASNCSSSPCTVYRQSGSAVSSVTRSSAGTYAMNLSSGVFSSTPVCTCTAGSLSQSDVCSIVTSSPSSTSTVVGLTVTNSSTGAATDDEASVICIGPK